jgi:hypothetical protein
MRAVWLFVTLVVALALSSQNSLGADHDWYQCPVGKSKHLDLNKISLIRDSVVGPNLHTLLFYSFGSHFLLGASASDSRMRCWHSLRCFCSRSEANAKIKEFGFP